MPIDLLAEQERIRVEQEKQMIAAQQLQELERSQDLLAQQQQPQGGGGGMKPNYQMAQKFIPEGGGGAAGAEVAGAEAGGATAGGGESAMAAAGPWAALAAAIIANEYSSKKAGRRDDDDADHLQDALTGAVLEQDADYYGDKVGGIGGKMIEVGGKLGGPEGQFDLFKKSLKPWEWF